MRWCVLPNVTHGTQQVMRHVSMGMKQPHSELSHGWADSGDLELRCSLGRARTSLTRAFHSSASRSVSGPGFWGPAAAWAPLGADMMMMGLGVLFGGNDCGVGIRGIEVEQIGK
jgi:hypothetical protein